jgi:hypothetical protein
MSLPSKAVAQYVKDRAANKVSYQSLDVGYNPFTNLGLIQPDAKLIELFVASRWFVDSPRKWSDLSRSHSSMRQVFLYIVELFNHLVQEIGTGVNSENGRYIPNQLCFFGMVPSNSEFVNRVGYTYRVMSQSEKGNIPSLLAELLEENKNRATARRKKRKSDRYDSYQVETEASAYIDSLTIEEYARLCSVYCGIPFNLDVVSATPVSDPDNPINPYRVFSLKRSAELAQAAGAHPDYCSEASFMDFTRPADENGESFPYAWPDPSLVWRMKPYHLVVGSSVTLYWPSVGAGNAASDPQLKAFIKAVAGDNPTPDELARAAYVYENCIGKSATVDDTPDDFDSLKTKHEQLLKEVDMVARSEEERQTLLKQAQMRTLNEFAAIFSHDSDAPDSIKAIARFMNQYLDETDSFCIPLEKTTSNLTRFGDEMITLMITLETLWGVNTQHPEVVALIFKAMHVYFLTPFNPHTLNTGPGMAGKSFGFQLLMKMLIEGTYKNSTYMSNKAHVIPGNKNQAMVWVYEDVQPGFIGIHGTGKGMETANTELESIVKSILTAGRLHGVVLDNNKLGRTQDEITAKVNAVVMAASNASSRQVPKPVGSRYHIGVCRSRDRIEGGGLLGKANKISNPTQTTAEQLFIRRMRRNQALLSVVALLTYVGVLPQVDMTVAKLVFTKVLEKAKKASLNGVEDIRNFERLEMVCRVLVVWDAISIMYDSPDSPLLGIPHDITHFLLIGRYLRSNVEHATMALGLLSNQFEDKIVHSILDDLMNTRFKSLKEKKKKKKPQNTRISGDKEIEREADRFAKPAAAGKKKKMNQTTLDGVSGEQSGENQQQLQSTEVGVVKEDDDYYICPFNDVNLNRSQRVDSDNDRIRILAHAQIISMQEKPLMDDLIGGYENMLGKRVAATDQSQRKPGDPPKMIPAFMFHNNEIYLSKHLVKENKNNALLKCTAEVINHACATACEYVYGVPRENCPFMLETIKVGPDVPGKKRPLHVIDPNFFDASLVNITEKYIMGLAKARAGSKKANKDTAEKFATFALGKAFSSLPRLIVDMDLNDYAETIFLHKEKYIQSDIDAMPDGNPVRRAAELVAMTEADGSSLISYPFDLPHAYPVRYINDQIKEVKRNPQKFSLKAHLKRMINNEGMDTEKDESRGKDEAEQQAEDDEDNEGVDDDEFDQQNTSDNEMDQDGDVLDEDAEWERGAAAELEDLP